MLAMLLPGVRHLRTPLIAGMLWFFDLWLIFGEDVVPSAEGSALEQRLLDAYEFLGRPIALGALATAAILVGDLLPTVKSLWNKTPIRVRGRERIVDAMTNFIPAQLTSLAGRVTWADIYAHGVAGPPRSVVDFAMKNPGHDADSGVSLEEFSHLLSRAVLDDEYIHLDQLQVSRPLVYNDIDRLEAEAELRFALALPLMVAIVAAAILSTPWILLTLFVPVALLRQASIAEVDAALKTMAAVFSGSIKSPTLEYLRECAQAKASQVRSVTKRGSSDPDPSGGRAQG